MSWWKNLICWNLEHHFGIVDTPNIREIKLSTKIDNVELLHSGRSHHKFMNNGRGVLEKSLIPMHFEVIFFLFISPLPWCTYHVRKETNVKNLELHRTFTEDKVLMFRQIQRLQFKPVLQTPRISSIADILGRCHSQDLGWSNNLDWVY